MRTLTTHPTDILLLGGTSFPKINKRAQDDAQKVLDEHGVRPGSLGNEGPAAKVTSHRDISGRALVANKSMLRLCGRARTRDPTGW